MKSLTTEPWYHDPVYLKTEGTLYKSKKKLWATFKTDGRRVSFGGGVKIGDKRVLDSLLAEKFPKRTKQTPQELAQYISKLPYGGQQFRNPSISEIAEKGGNCDDKAMLGLYLLRRLGYPVRSIFEATHVPRGKDTNFSEEIIEDIPCLGGDNVNSHVYLQVYDSAIDQTFLLDPTLNRPNCKAFFKSMLFPYWLEFFPLIIFAGDQNGHFDNTTINISEKVIIDGLEAHYPVLKQEAPQTWKKWTRAIHFFNHIETPRMLIGANSLKKPRQQKIMAQMRECIEEFRKIVKED